MWIRTVFGTLINMDAIECVAIDTVGAGDTSAHRVICVALDDASGCYEIVRGDEEKCQKYVKELARELNVFSVEGTHPCACGQCDCKDMVIDSMLICDACHAGNHVKEAAIAS